MSDAQKILAAGQDPFLVALVIAAATKKLEMALTVTVGGATVTGRLVSHERWLEALDDSLDGEGTFRQETIAPSPETESGEDVTYNHIHLISAAYCSGGGVFLPTGGGGMVWRGRLSAVTSWSLGSFVRPDPS